MTTKKLLADTELAFRTLTHAVQDLADTFSDPWTSRQVGQHMTCTEAEILRAVIALVDPLAAGAFLRGHANGEGDGEGDEPSDMHYHLRDDFNSIGEHFYAGKEDVCLGCGNGDDYALHIS